MCAIRIWRRPALTSAACGHPGVPPTSITPRASSTSNRFLGSGSSQSAAVTAGAVALLLSADPELTNDEIKQLLIDIALSRSAASSSIVGAGVLDVAAAHAGASTVDPRRDARAVVDGFVVDR